MGAKESINSRLIVACTLGDVKQTKELLEKGADPSSFQNHYDESGNYLSTSTTYLRAKNLEILKLLFEYGGDLNFVHQDDACVMYSAFAIALPKIFAKQDMEFLALCISKGAEVNKPLECIMGYSEHFDTKTPLHYAVIAQSVEGAKLLLQAGANVNETRTTQKQMHHKVETSLHLACSLFTVNSQNAISMVSLLVGYGADLNAFRVESKKNTSFTRKETALHLAITNRYMPLVWTLVEHGASLTIPCSVGDKTYSTKDLCGNNEEMRCAVFRIWNQKWFRFYPRYIQDRIISFLIINKRKGGHIDKHAQQRIISYIVKTGG